MEATATTYDFPAVFADPLDAHDGDTLWLHISKVDDIGFHLVATYTARIKFRLTRVNAPELKTGAPGAAATAFTRAWLAAHAANLRVTSLGPDNYGDRWDANVYCADTGENLSDALLASGNAVPWP